MEKNEKPKKAKKSSVGHTRAIALDRSKRPNSAPSAAEIEAVLSEIIQPATFSLVRLYQEMGLRSRTLTLPVMVAFVTSLIWRQLGSVSEAARVLRREGLLWQPPIKVTQQALSERLRDLPASLFEAILNEILPKMHKRWHSRNRPLAPTNRLSLNHFKQVLAVDGSTLDSLLKKCGLLRESEAVELGGKMVALLDINSQLPQKVWYSEQPNQHDQSWWEQILAALAEDSLVLFDLGYVNYAYYQRLSEEHKYFVTRVKSNMVYQVFAELASLDAGIDEQLVYIGSIEQGNRQLLRLVTVEFEGKNYQYLTNVLDQARLIGTEIAELYRQRWRIEDAFKTVKRLLGLAYFHASSLNAVALQLWATWILYSVVIDLADGVAEELNLPTKTISLEMVYRGLYHYSQALTRGDTRSVFQYLAQDAKLLGIIKRPRNRPRRT